MEQRDFTNKNEDSWSEHRELLEYEWGYNKNVTGMAYSWNLYEHIGNNPIPSSYEPPRKHSGTEIQNASKQDHGMGGVFNFSGVG